MGARRGTELNHVRSREPEGSEREPGLTSIVILTLNQLEYTRMCFESIYAFTAEPFELIVVDNGSTDDTRMFLRELAGRRDNVKVVLNSENTGFAGGCSQGMAVARGEYILLLNNDVIVTEGWLSRMRRPLEADPTIGIVGPRSNCVSGVQILLDVPYSDVTRMHAFARERAETYAGQGMFLPIVIGFAMLMRADLIEAIGGLDTRFGSGNFEDDDFCLRAQLAGQRIWMADDVFIHHFGSRTFMGQKVDYEATIKRNEAIFREKWNLDEPLEDRYGIDRLVETLQGRFSLEQLFVPLPDPATVPLVIERVEIEGVERFNLLLDADWSGPAEAWLPSIAAFVEGFSARDPVALVVSGASDEALAHIGAVLDPLGDEAADVLSIEGGHSAAGLLGACRGVVLADPAKAARTRHWARLLGLPVLERPDRQALLDWFAQCEGRTVGLA